jgi:hypothetical protein
MHSFLPMKSLWSRNTKTEGCVLLFAYCEYHGSDCAADMARIAAGPKMLKGGVS